MTRGHKGRTDGNHTEVVTALRKAGIGAISTAAVGAGFGDIAAGFRGLNVLIEVKDGAKALTAAEREFHATWPGHIIVAESAEAAIAGVLAHAKRLGVI